MLSLTSSYAGLPGALYSPVDPSARWSVTRLWLNTDLARQLGLDPAQLASPAGLQLLAGAKAPAGQQPIAQAYAGHQFGHLAILGDGRALLLGELRTPNGAFVDIQLKGSGLTPYSRRGDGLAALAPMLRE
ncbi:MAG: protein adenylyltransferase SelO family protein, partial [Fluviibacter sp.]